MKKTLSSLLLYCSALTMTYSVQAQQTEFSFGFLGQSMPIPTDESTLSRTFQDADAEGLAFVVVNGIKAEQEPCDDNVLARRKTLFDNANSPIIVSLAGNDWNICKNPTGASAAIERLNRIREVFFSDERSLKKKKITLIHQSATSKFRSYAENVRWEHGDILFATINLPANNNHYLNAAGRNSEFEDRLVANRDWLLRIFNFASRKKLAGIVLFSDGDPFTTPEDQDNVRDGFSEIRKQLISLTAKFPGKVLLVHGASRSATSTPPTINWRDNLGEAAVSDEWARISIDTASPTLFSLISSPP